MNEETVKSALDGLPVPQVRWFDSISSTNDVALQWVSEGVQEGCLVMADAQTQGRGRFGRRWVTQPEDSLAFSIIMKPRAEEIPQLGLFSPLGALAICQALEADWRLKPLIKWPNDVLLSGRKAAGILVEVVWSGNDLQGLVIGIGLNIAPSSVPPDEQVLYPATCVEQAVGGAVDRMQALRSILAQLFRWRAQPLGEVFFAEWQKRLAFLGESVQIDWDAQQRDSEEPSVRGVFVGLDQTGNALIRLPSGEKRAVSVGDVHFRPV